MAQTLHDRGVIPDPEAIHAALRRMAEALARHLAPRLGGLIDSLAEPGPFSPDARAAGRRALRLAALGLTTRVDDGRAAEAAFARADNMTEEVGALACLLTIGRGQPALAAFEARWSHERHVMDKWFALQILHAAPAEAAGVADRLTRHPAFDWKNPNRFRAVIGALSANHAGFHAAGGASYRLVADWLLRLDPLNPQTAARMSTAFETWTRYDAGRRAQVASELARILRSPGLSADLGEMAGRMLEGGS
jgi:aminopeptidase N